MLPCQCSTSSQSLKKVCWSSRGTLLDYSFKKNIKKKSIKKHKKYVFSRKGYLLWPQFPTEHSSALVEALKLCFDHGKTLFFQGKHPHRSGKSLKGPGLGKRPIFNLSPKSRWAFRHRWGISQPLSSSALPWLASRLREEKPHFVLFWGIFQTELWHVRAAPCFQTGRALFLPCPQLHRNFSPSWHLVQRTCMAGVGEGS